MPCCHLCAARFPPHQLFFQDPAFRGGQEFYISSGLMHYLYYHNMAVPQEVLDLDRFARMHGTIRKPSDLPCYDIPIGYWRSTADEKSPYPWPQPDKSKKCTPELLSEIQKFLETHGERVNYQGFSHCRLCSQINGSMEYTISRADHPAGKYRIPEGLMHYLQDHDVPVPFSCWKFCKIHRWSIWIRTH